MCAGANSRADRISKTDLAMMPLNKNTMLGRIDRAKALNRLFFFQQMIQMPQ